MPREPWSAITIDVDPIRLYQAIHGLEGQSQARDPVYRFALSRFFSLLHDVGVPSTVFFVGKDAEGVAKPLRAGLDETGSELASHSFHHSYRLSQQSPEAIRADLVAADRALAAVSGQPVLGFRAPGYNTSPQLLQTLVALGYRYDSSLLPAPAYYAARATAIAWYRLRGRPSASMAGDLRAFWGPRQPYRMTPEAPWTATADGPLVEMPMAVAGWSRWPLIGTSWVMMPNWLDRWAHRAAGPGFVFEMHAVDLLDATDPGIPPAVAAAQPDLNISAKVKIERFRTLFRRLQDHSRVETMADLALGDFRM